MLEINAVIKNNACIKATLNNRLLINVNLMRGIGVIIPARGITGQALTKVSDKDYDMKWMFEVIEDYDNDTKYEMQAYVQDGHMVLNFTEVE